VLSHRSAAALWGLCDRNGTIDVTTQGRDRRHDGVRIHRTRLTPADITRREDLAVTIADRTLLDLATTLPRTELELAVNEAFVRKNATVRGLRSYLARDPSRRGAARLAALLHDHRGISRSRAERALHALIRKSGIPPPLTNTRVAGYEVDCYWREIGLVVEVDSAGFHGTPHAFQVDRAKEAALNDAGLRLIRVTRWEVVRQPEATIARLARATARAGGATAGLATAARPP
jgi:very-short-patch-repair endonuclease